MLKIAPLFASVYVGRLDQAKTHLIEADESGRCLKVLCGRVKVTSVCDDSTWEDPNRDIVPTCRTCRQKWDKLVDDGFLGQVA